MCVEDIVKLVMSVSKHFIDRNVSYVGSYPLENVACNSIFCVDIKSHP